MKHLFTLKQFLNENNNKKVIAYHGTPYGEFEKFSMDNRGTGADVKGYGDYGKGFYFTPDKELAKSYANYVGKKRKLEKIQPVLYTVELTMNNPLDLRKLGVYQKRLLELTTKYDGIFNIPDEEIDNILSDLGLTEEQYDLYQYVQGSLVDNYGDFEIEYSLEENGFDSLISHDGKEYIIHNPNNIKIINVEKL